MDARRQSDLATPDTRPPITDLSESMLDLPGEISVYNRGVCWHNLLLGSLAANQPASDAHTTNFILRLQTNFQTGNRILNRGGKKWQKKLQLQPHCAWTCITYKFLYFSRWRCTSLFDILSQI
jgi:hypothetical protein